MTSSASGSLPGQRTHRASAWLLVFLGCLGQLAHAADAGTLQIWFVRHAESELNVPNAPRPVPDGGMSYPLTRRGVDQALALAETLGSEPVQRIYTSTHLRAVQTADAIAFRHRKTISLAPEAVELNVGAGEGEDSRAIYTEATRRWLVEDDTEYRHGNGESFADLQRRFLPFVRELMVRHAHDPGIIVIVSHSGTLGLMVPVLAPNIPADFSLRNPLPNTGIIKTELRDGRLYARSWGTIASEAFAPVGVAQP